MRNLLLLLLTVAASGLQLPTRLPNAGRVNAVRRSLLLSPVLVTFMPRPSNAERTLGTITESYNRYVPRMSKGFAYLRSLEPLAADPGGKSREEIMGVVEEVRAERGTTLSALKGTMSIFATSFSDSVITDTTRELQLAEKMMSEELDKLAHGLEKGGDRGAEIAIEGWKSAVYYGDVYVGIMNANLPRTLEPVVGPKGVAGKRFEDVDRSINGAF